MIGSRITFSKFLKKLRQKKMDRKFTKDEQELFLMDFIGDDFLCSEIGFLLETNGFTNSESSDSLPWRRRSVRQDFLKGLLYLYIFLKKVPSLDILLLQLKNTKSVQRFLRSGKVNDRRNIVVFPEIFPHTNSFVVLPNHFYKEAFRRAQLNNLSSIFVPSCNLFIQFKKVSGLQSSAILESKYPLPVSIVRNSLHQRKLPANSFHRGVVLIVSDSSVFDRGTIYNEELLTLCKKSEFNSVTFVSETDQKVWELDIGLSSNSKVFSTRILNSHNYELLLSLIGNASAVCNLTDTNFNFFKRVSDLSEVPYFSFTDFEDTENAHIPPFTILGRLRLFSDQLRIPHNHANFPEELNSEDSFRLMISSIINEIEMHHLSDN
jgi:hypothetical protein